MNKTVKPDLKRRDFLRGSVVTGASVTLVAAAPGLAQAQPEPEAAVQPAGQPKNKGYQLTEHVSAYYKSAAL